MDQKRLPAKKNEAIKIANLTEYQEGSIVSRTLVDKKAGTITFFAFDKNQGLSEHVAPYDAIVYVSDGEAEVMISGITHLVKQGEIIVLPANEPHALKAKVRFKMMLTMIRA